MTTREIKVGDIVITDSHLLNRLTGAIRAVKEVSGNRVYLDEPIFFESKKYVSKKTIVGVFKTREEAQAVVDADKAIFDEISKLQNKQRETLADNLRKAYTNQQLTETVA